MDKKACPGCYKLKPVSAFGKNKTKADGLQFYCKDCRRRRRKGSVLLEEKPKEENIKKEPKECFECGGTKQADEFYPSDYERGYYRCKECRNKSIRRKKIERIKKGDE